MYGKHEINSLLNYGVAPHDGGLEVHASVQPAPLRNSATSNVVGVKFVTNDLYSPKEAGVKFQHSASPNASVGHCVRAFIPDTARSPTGSMTAWSGGGVGYLSATAPSAAVQRAAAQFPEAGAALTAIADSGLDPRSEDGPAQRPRAGVAPPPTAPPLSASTPGVVLGGRWLSPHSSSLFGLQLWNTPGTPLSVWNATAVNKNTVVGAQVTLPLQPLATSIQAMGGVANGGAKAGFESALKGGTVQLGCTTGDRPSYLFNVVGDFPLASVCKGGSLDGGSVTMRYLHSMTSRRAVYNPLEAVNVKGIWNYVDFGVEVTRSLEVQPKTDITAGAAWQANRQIMLKGAAGTSRGLDATLAWRSWGDPVITLSATAGVTGDSIAAGTPSKGVRVGMRLSIEKGGRARYQRPVRGYQHATPSKAYVAIPALNERIESGEPRPVDSLWESPAVDAYAVSESPLSAAL